MKKKIVSFTVSICLIYLCLVPPVFAEDSAKENYDIDRIYAEAYTKAFLSEPMLVASDESAYAYLISHMGYLQRRNDDTIQLITLDETLSETERDTVLSFVGKLNTLIQLNAISVDDRLQLHFVFDPVDENREAYRIQAATILGEARNHAIELKAVFDNAVFSQRHFTAGMYFAQRVKSGGIWDYKSYMGANTLYYMEDLKTNMTGETIGNFHYGYVGRSVFDAATLKSVAGMYQIHLRTCHRFRVI